MRSLPAVKIFAGFAVLLLALSALDARGQARSTAGGPGSYLAAGGGVSAFQEDYGQQVIGGAWLFVDMNPTWRYGIETKGINLETMGTSN